MTENPIGTGNSSRNELPEPSLVGIASVPAEAITRETDLGEVLPAGESCSEGTRARKRESPSDSYPPEESGLRYNLRRRRVTHFSNSILNLFKFKSFKFKFNIFKIQIFQSQIQIFQIQIQIFQIRIQIFQIQIFQILIKIFEIQIFQFNLKIRS